ncbi:hypothetical protein A2947_02710 [Candidatus Peribacteria bacterium RIFCSPLOWO2_01_FULL_54_110]|nr:MAG: hypothetical protein A2947_02710 [Candidatus Peribacteria bacterium RIFCSPLOWO2_01_FULL_54_110]
MFPTTITTACRQAGCPLPSFPIRILTIAYAEHLQHGDFPTMNITENTIVADTETVGSQRPIGQPPGKVKRVLPGNVPIHFCDDAFRDHSRQSF